MEKISLVLQGKSPGIFNLEKCLKNLPVRRLEKNPMSFVLKEASKRCFCLEEGLEISPGCLGGLGVGAGSLGLAQYQAAKPP